MRQIMDILDLGCDKMQRLANNQDLREKTRNVLKHTIAQVKASNARSEAQPFAGEDPVEHAS